MRDRMTWRRHCFRPFLEELVVSDLAPKTIQKHVDNLWVWGGEIIRYLHDDPSLRKKPTQILDDRIDDDGGPLVYAGESEEQQQRSFDSTCKKLHRSSDRPVPAEALAASFVCTRWVTSPGSSQPAWDRSGESSCRHHFRFVKQLSGRSTNQPASALIATKPSGAWLLGYCQTLHAMRNRRQQPHIVYLLFRYPNQIQILP